MVRLLKEVDDSTVYKEVQLEQDPERLRGLLNETRWKIMQLLAERPRYPAEIADQLDLQEQNVYYHIRELKESGMIEVVERKERGGATAKYYDVTAYAYALELPFGDEYIADFSVTDQPPQLKSFLHPFIHNGKLNARIVVGSPDPHGPHQVRARDSHLATDIAAFIGQFGAFTERCTVQDVDVKSAESYDGNMILLGGPLTNMVTSEVNAHLPVKFRQENFPFRTIVSTQTGTEYTDDSIGFLAKVPNPHDPESSVLVVAGVRMKGTQAAVLALTEQYDNVLADYDGEEKWGVIVKGKDMDGDGDIDAVEVVE